MTAQYSNRRTRSVEVSIDKKTPFKGRYRCYRINQETGDRVYLKRLETGRKFMDARASGVIYKYYAEVILVNGQKINSTNYVSPVIKTFNFDEFVKISNINDTTIEVSVDPSHFIDDLIKDTLNIDENYLEIFKDEIKNISSIAGEELDLTIFIRKLNNSRYLKMGSINGKNNFKIQMPRPIQSELIVKLQKESISEKIEELKHLIKTSSISESADIDKIKKQYMAIIKDEKDDSGIDVISKIDLKKSAYSSKGSIYLHKPRSTLLNNESQRRAKTPSTIYLDVIDNVIANFIIDDSSYSSPVAVIKKPKIKEFENNSLVLNISPTNLNFVKYILVKYENGASFLSPCPPPGDYFILVPEASQSLKVDFIGYDHSAILTQAYLHRSN